MGSSGAVTSTLPASGYRVDDLVIDVGQQRVWRGDTELRFAELSLKFLVVLVRHAPNVVSFDELIESVWSGSVVSPETVTQRVKLVREALGDDPHAPRYVGAVRGRGYRLICAARPFDAATAESSISPASSDSPDPRTVRWRLAAIAIGAVLLASGLTAYLQARDQAETAAAPRQAATPTTIAVLPFVNLGDEPESEYFSDGLSEELLNRLTLIPELQVVARTSSFHFKGRSEDIRTIGRMLAARHVLEGSVRRQGDRVRVTTQLVDTENGYRLWSKSFDRKLADVMAIQDEVASAVAENLKLTLVSRAKVPRTSLMTSSPEAFDLYLRGKHLYQSWKLDRIDRGIEHFREAIHLDPHFAAAYVSLAAALFARSQATGECCDPHGAWTKPRGPLLQRALELDPGNADAIASVGFDLMMNRDFSGAARELHRAEAINPNGELVLRHLSNYYNSVGWPPERGIDYARRRFRLDPLNAMAATDVAAAYWQVHQYEEALKAADIAIELDPNAWFGRWIRSGALIDLNRFDEAIESAHKVFELSGGVPNTYQDLVAAYAGAGKMDEARKYFAAADDPKRKQRWRQPFRASALVALGRKEDAIRALEQAYRENDGFLHEALHWKILMPLHDDPRFQALARKLGQERRVQHTRDVNRARLQAAVAN